jgi:hypothetical protein
MLIKTLTGVASICGLMAVAFIGLTVGQETTGPSKLIKSVISIDSDSLERNRPAIVSISLENLSRCDVDLEVICSFELRAEPDEATNSQAQGGSYWSPLDISTGTPLELVDPRTQKKATTLGRVPRTLLHFRKDEVKTFKVELTKLLWDASVSSRWPYKNLFDEVPKRRYSLVFRVDSNGNLESNAVAIRIA